MDLEMPRKLLEDIKEGRSHFHAIEIMACPGGCIGGGGQPYHHGDSEILKQRAAALYREDVARQSGNPTKTHSLLNCIKNFLGKPLGEKSHHLLHTKYFDKSASVFVEEYESKVRSHKIAKRK
jgi:NADP-reducing hydrogenase subunit HndD